MFEKSYLKSKFLTSDAIWSVVDPSVLVGDLNVLVGDLSVLVGDFNVLVGDMAMLAIRAVAVVVGSPVCVCASCAMLFSPGGLVALVVASLFASGRFLTSPCPLLLLLFCASSLLICILSLELSLWQTRSDNINFRNNKFSCCTVIRVPTFPQPQNSRIFPGFSRNLTPFSKYIFALAANLQLQF